VELEGPAVAPVAVTEIDLPADRAFEVYDAPACFAVREEVLVRGHGALGEAGGSARVEDGGQVARLEVVDHIRVTLGHRRARLEHVARP